MEQIPDLPCPNCRSTTTLGSLRKKREEVRARIAEQARKRYPKPNFGFFGNAIATPQSMTLSAGVGTLMYNASASEITIQAASQDSLVGAIEINGAILDVCIECGTFYSPNAKRLGEEILDETIRLDPLGALAEIGDTEDALFG